MIGAAVCAAVLIMLPLVEDFANVFAGLGGAAGRRRSAASPPRLARRRERQARLTVDKFTALTPELHRYAVEHSSFRDGVVPEVEAAAEEMGGLPLMQIAGDQAALTTILVQAIGARRCARGRDLPRLRRDRDRPRPPRGRRAGLLRAGAGVRRPCPRAPRRGAGLADRVEIRVGPAIETLRAMPDDEPFDFAFIDADKAGYPDYYEECLRLVRARAG